MYKEIMCMYESSDTGLKPRSTDRPALEDINMKDAETIHLYLSFLDYDINNCTIDLKKYYERLTSIKKQLEDQKIYYKIENVDCIKLISNIRDLNQCLIERGLIIKKMENVKLNSTEIQDYLALKDFLVA